MFVSEDGTVTGSIDRSQLAGIVAQTDEAQAQLDALQAEWEGAPADVELPADEAKAKREVNAPSSPSGELKPGDQDKAAAKKPASSSGKE